MEMVTISIKMEIIIKAIGRMIADTAKVSCTTTMELLIQAIGKKENSRIEGSLLSRKDRYIAENGSLVKCMVEECMLNPMEASCKVYGNMESFSTIDILRSIQFFKIHNKYYHFLEKESRNTRLLSR
jgi:hypothetical protein